MVNDWLTNEIRGKLLDPLESKEFIPFSTFILDTSLNDLFFSDTSAEWNLRLISFIQCRSAELRLCSVLCIPSVVMMNVVAPVYLLRLKTEFGQVFKR